VEFTRGEGARRSAVVSESEESSEPIKGDISQALYWVENILSMNFDLENKTPGSKGSKDASPVFQKPLRTLESEKTPKLVFQ